jgi:hypothetical protein
MTEEIKTPVFKKIFQESSQKSTKILGCCCYLLGVNLNNCIKDQLIEIFQVISFHSNFRNYLTVKYQKLESKHLML